MQVKIEVVKNHKQLKKGTEIIIGQEIAKSLVDRKIAKYSE
tara:strand:+ start:5929 stop:6051 length:123 start_codon:yes stop_codon:yes gene_type:complete